MPHIQKIVLMGSPEYALPTLQAVASRFSESIVGVFTQPDKPKGRGQHLEPTPIKAWALNSGYTVYTPSTKQEVQNLCFELEPDFILVIAYGMILPKALTDRFFCLNSHGSLLPLYRGASPIHAALLNGDSHTGVTLIRMNEKMDEGDILAIESCPILSEDTLKSVHDKLAQLSASLCLNFLVEYAQNKHHSGTPQDASKATNCHKLSSEDRQLLPEETSEQKWRKIKAFSPSPGAYWMQDGKRIKILEAFVDRGALIPVKIQPEGKPPMRYADYCLGNTKGLTL